MPADEDLQKILGRVRAELLHAEVFEDEQVDARELLHEIAAGAGRVRLGEVGGEIEGAAHERAAAGPNRADGDRRRDVRFADAGSASSREQTLKDAGSPLPAVAGFQTFGRGRI
jgi:hypothetical protein